MIPTDGCTKCSSTLPESMSGSLHLNISVASDHYSSSLSKNRALSFQQQNKANNYLRRKLMNAQCSIFASVGIAILFATASFAQQVKTDYDRSADFSQYKTYSWEKVQTQDPLWVGRIIDAVNAVLSAKGWTQVESGGQAAIVAMEMTKNQQTVNTFYDGFGGGWGWRRFGGGGLETQLQQRRTIRSALSSWMFSMRTART